MVVIDLESDGWPVFSAPYLATVHSTAITCTAHVSDANGAFWNKLKGAGRRQLTGFSCRVTTNFFLMWSLTGVINGQFHFFHFFCSIAFVHFYLELHVKFGFHLNA